MMRSPASFCRMPSLESIATTSLAGSDRSADVHQLLLVEQLLSVGQPAHRQVIAAFGRRLGACTRVTALRPTHGEYPDHQQPDQPGRASGRGGEAPLAGEAVAALSQ